MLRAAVLVGTLVPVVLLRVIHAVLAAVPFAVGVTAEAPTGLSARGRQTDREEQGSGPKAHGDRGLRVGGGRGAWAGWHVWRAVTPRGPRRAHSLSTVPRYHFILGWGGGFKQASSKVTNTVLTKNPSRDGRTVVLS